jgi:RNA polymerase sigma-70 factor (ECF subfamily)
MMLDNIMEPDLKLNRYRAYVTACPRLGPSLRAVEVRRSNCLEGSRNRLQIRPNNEISGETRKVAAEHNSGDTATALSLDQGLLNPDIALNPEIPEGQGFALDDGAVIVGLVDGRPANASLGAAVGGALKSNQDSTRAHDLAAEDDEMVRKTVAGDSDCFEVLVRRHSPRVFNIIGSFFRRRDMVEDIAQDVFIKSYTSLASYTLGRSFEAWLARITVNCCYDHLRAQRRRGEQSSPQDPEAEGDWLDLQMLEASISQHASVERQREAADIADRLLSKLEPDDRVVLILMDRDGFSVKEISDMTGWGTSKVKVRAFRARRTLRAAMKRLVTAAERKQGKAK